MATKKKLLQAAAGNAGGGAGLDVDEVFSTYLYEGTGATQSIENNIALGDFGVGTSTEFDGANDYLSRSSDLAGNSDGKTFTFSVWGYFTGNGTLIDLGPFGEGAYIYVSSTYLFVQAYNASNTKILEFYYNGVPKNTWANIQFSIDLANTSNRHVFLDDVEVTSGVTWSTYTNDSINFTTASSKVGDTANANGKMNGRLAHCYLDYTYRDLSVGANRRLFIDANGGSTSPSTLSALSPIIYLPMTETYTIGENLGTGGNFAANGLPAIVQYGTEYQEGYGEGGMVWYRRRDGAENNSIEDTVRGLDKVIYTDSANAQADPGAYGLQAFNSNGFTAGLNTNGGDYASWTFLKSKRFFDIQTWTGDGTDGRQISHNLSTTIGSIFVKNTSSGSTDWMVYHRGCTDQDSTHSNSLALNENYGQMAWKAFGKHSTQTSSVFTLGTSSPNEFFINQSGQTYVAYIFAHNDGDGEFGPDGDQDIIKCGSFTTDGSGFVPEVDLGFEPSWMLVKQTNAANSWYIIDALRDWSHNSTVYLRANLNNAEGTWTQPYFGSPTPTGFKGNLSSGVNNGTFIYIAIRRGPLAPPDSATEVFGIDNNTGQTGMTTGVVTDFGFAGQRSGTDKYYVGTRLLQGSYLNFNSTASESSSTAFSFDQMDGFFSAAGSWNGYIGYGWKRAPSYMDCVAFSGNGSYPRNISHNLGVVPEMMWVKARNAADHWRVYSKDMTVQQEMLLNGTYAASATGSWGTGGRPTDSVFIVGSANTNYSGRNYIAYLFASLDGISKVGSYTGNGSFQTIDCGFSAGSRFVLIKRTDATGDWYVWDAERGITQAADPYLELNTTAAETTGNKNYLYPANSGFGVQEITGTNNPNINVSGATYIFYAIA